MFYPSSQNAVRWVFLLRAPAIWQSPIGLILLRRRPPAPWKIRALAAASAGAHPSFLPACREASLRLVVRDC